MPLLLTIIRDCWQRSSCPKLPQRHLREFDAVRGGGGGPGNVLTMDFVQDFITCWAGLPVLFVFSVVVFFHELGHFLVGRWCGVRILPFSIGFGPELFGFYDRHGTRWKVSIIPLGGYVKFLGDENAASVPDRAAVAQMSEEERRESFINQPVGKRAAIVAAGPFANFILAILIFAGFAMYM